MAMPIARRSLLAMPLLAPLAKPADRIRVFGRDWSVPIGADWKVETEAGEEVLHLVTPRPQEKDPRAPYQYALAETPHFRKVTLEAEVKRLPGAKSMSLIVVYAWRDPTHFDYAHISADSPNDQPVHNGIFHVYGGDRVRISAARGPAALPTDAWTPIKLDYDAATGRVEVRVAGALSPSMQAVDLSLDAGRVGLGSFFHAGWFRRVKITGQA
jgi:hypothetical protein